MVRESSIAVGDSRATVVGKIASTNKGGLGRTAPTPQKSARQTRHKGPSDILEHAASEIAVGSKLGIDGTKKPSEGFKRPWPQLIKMDSAVKGRVEESTVAAKTFLDSPLTGGSKPVCE
jgi:hypothetical protein